MDDLARSGGTSEVHRRYIRGTSEVHQKGTSEVLANVSEFSHKALETVRSIFGKGLGFFVSQCLIEQCGALDC